MIDADEIMPLNFFDYGGIYSGEHHGMRYRLREVKGEENKTIEASVWQGPYSFDMQSEVTTESFECSDAGRLKAIEWLDTQYKEHPDLYENKVSILKANINLDDIYRGDT